MTPVPWKLWEGQVVDLYFPLRRYLGGTDRSAVYLTQYGDPEPRNAAIKLVPAETTEADPAQWERAAQLSHPNLLRLLRTGRCQVNQLSLRYAVSEYAEENLAEVLAERPLTVAEVREMLKPLLGAMAYIHREGLVHGHVKPANVLASGDQLKLSVDGITLVGEPGAPSAEPGPYDPPEFQDRGCSPVGDVWSFGITLVEALTRQLPRSNGPKQDPALPHTVPAEFLPMARACLRADPRRRASLDDIVDFFERPQPVPQPIIVAAAPVYKSPIASRKWLSAVLVCGTAVALAGILAGPRLLHRPVANAQADRVAIVPASTAVPAPVEEKLPTPPAPVEEKPVVAPPPPKPEAHAPERTVEASSTDIVRRVMPDVSDAARRTIRGKVKIQVRATVDAAGHVTDATVESQNSKYFAKLALEAARKWEFAASPNDWILRFEFTTGGDSVRPSRVGR